MKRERERVATRSSREIADRQRCTKIATGHTLDDQAETVLMRLLRGTGWDGLRGIRPIHASRIIRPLIHCSRMQVLAFLQSCGLPFCQDSSNADRRFLRNRVRHEVIPVLRAINPNVVAHLASAAEIIGGESALLEERARAALACGLAPDGDTGTRRAHRCPSATAWANRTQLVVWPARQPAPVDGGPRRGDWQARVWRPARTAESTCRQGWLSFGNTTVSAYARRPCGPKLRREH